MTLLDLGLLEDTEKKVLEPKVYHQKVFDPIGTPPYFFEIDWSTYTFILNRDKQPLSMQKMTSKEVARVIQDDFDNFLRKESAFYEGSDFYVHKNGDGVVTGDPGHEWLLRIDTSGVLTINAAFDAETNFAYWVLSSLDGKKIKRK
jgi:hypothetical protein